MADKDDELPSSRGSRPVPDPTELTTKALEREIARVEERIDDLKEFVLREFESIERHRLEQKEDTKAAVDAALTAQKESVAKSEAAVSKQIDQLTASIDKTTSDIRRELSEVKERVSETDKKVGG